MKRGVFEKSFLIFVLIIGLFFLTNVCFVGAEDIYITQTATGSDSGSDCVNAHSVFWFNTAGNWNSAVNTVDGKIGPGDIVHLCGTFTFSAGQSGLTVHGDGASGNVITILFEDDAKLQAPYFSTLGAIDIGAYGYFRIDGGANGIIENTADGSAESGLAYDAASSGIRMNGAANIEICNLVIRNIFINTGGDNPSATDSTGLNTAGILIDDNGGTWSDIRIHDNIISNSRAGIWANFEDISASGLHIYNNYLDDHAWMIIVGAGAADSVVTDVDIHDNEMTDWNNWQYPISSYHTDGLIIFSNSGTGTSSYSGRFYNNYVHGSLGAGSPSGYIGTGCGGKNFLIYDNFFKCENPGRGGSCMVVYDAGPTGCSAGQPEDTTFYNNLCVGDSTTASSWEGLAIRAARTGLYMTVKNNIFINYHHPLEDVNSDYSGFSGGGSTDYNLYEGYTYIVVYSVTDHKTLSQWQAAPYNQEAHGISSDPLFVSSADFHLQSTSPAIDAGTDLSSYFTTDKDGVTRPQGSGWDIGAYEYVSGTPTASCGPADANSDNTVDSGELIAYISKWKSGDVLISDLMNAIGEWKNGC